MNQLCKITASIIGVVLLLLIILHSLPESSQSIFTVIIVGTHSLIGISLSGYLLLKSKNRPIEIGKLSYRLLCLGFLTWAFSDVFWNYNYLMLRQNCYTKTASYLVTFPCSIAFYFLFAGIFSAIHDKRYYFLKNKFITLLSLAITLVIYLGLFYSKLSEKNQLEFQHSFIVIERFAITSEVLLMALSLIIFFLAEDLDWSLFTAGLMLIVLGDSSYRVDKLTKSTEVLDINTFLVLTGYYTALVSLFLFQKCKLTTSQATNLFVENKLATLLGSVFFMAVFIGLVYDLNVLRLLCPVFAMSILVALFFSNTINEHEIKRRNDAILVFKKLESFFISKQKSDAHNVSWQVESALKIVQLPQVPKKVQELLLPLLRQISHCVNDPIAKYKVYGTPIIDFGDFYQDLIIQDPHLLRDDISISALINNILELKAFEKKNKSIKFVFDLTEDSFKLFIKAYETDMIIALSNIINNAMDAITESGSITIRLAQINNQVSIQIQDTGTGIPLEHLHLLGSFGKTFKKHGSGYGIHHAIESVKSMGGTFLNPITKLGLGTTFELRLPCQKTPQWFLPFFSISPGLQIILVDSDQKVHDIFKAHLEFWAQHSIRIHLTHCYSKKDYFDQLPQTCPTHPKLCFFQYRSIHKDLELRQVISELQLKENEIIITSDLSDPQTRDSCTQLNLKLIAKCMIPSFRSIYEGKSFAWTEKKEEDLLQNVFSDVTHVLIDNEPIVRKSWESDALNHGINIKTFKNFESFFKIKHLFSKSIHIYIDAHLDNGVRGDIESIKLINDFSSIYLLTHDLRIKKPPHMTDVIYSKLSPWGNL